MAKRPKLPKGYFWRGEIIWCRTDPLTGKQSSTKLSDPKGLRAWERDREKKAEDPRNAAASRATLGEWIAEIIEIKSQDKSPATVGVYRQKLGHFVRIWGEDTRLIDITPSACDAYTKKRRTEASDHTITKEFSALSQMLKAARRVGAYPHDIAALRPLNVAPRYVPRKRHLSWDEFELLLEECSPRLGAIVTLAVVIGARLSEALRFAPCDLVNWEAHIRGTKTDEADAVIPVLAPFRSKLLAVMGQLPVREYQNNLRRDLLAACKRAGIDPCTPNDLRRTFASLMIAAGVDKEVVRRFMRHKTSRMVEMVYGKTSPKDLERLARHALPALLLGDGSATKNATVIEATGEEVETQPNSRANSEGRTPDLRFTKPKTLSGKTQEEAENQAERHTSSPVETQLDTASRATESATVLPSDLAKALGDLVDAVLDLLQTGDTYRADASLGRAQPLLARYDAQQASERETGGQS